MSTASAPRLHTVAFGKLLWVAPLGGLAATAANLIVYGLVTLGLGWPLVMPISGPTSPAVPLPMSMVVFASFVPALAAGILLAVLGKVARQPVRWFVVIAGAALLFSLGGPLSLPVDAATKLALVPMHLIAALAITGTLSKFGATRR
jgi:hypothetical protein